MDWKRSPLGGEVGFDGEYVFILRPIGVWVGNKFVKAYRLFLSDPSKGGAQREIGQEGGITPLIFQTLRQGKRYAEEFSAALRGE